ncbi:MAG TPA: hypothetical protein VFT95_12235 [Micromonosporaceae bacterium]|nr:hypothetical protein [Micromonosporaceae bacterium]
MTTAEENGFGLRPTVHRIANEYADVWIGSDADEDVDYAYGGTRMVPPETPDAEVEQMLVRLLTYESWLKNRLINQSIRAGVLDDLGFRLPPDFLGSTVGGGRCLIRPRDSRVYGTLADPTSERFHGWIGSVFRDIGGYLNARAGRIKLTPDFGGFAGLADILRQFTPHVLGIQADQGGCGGKTSYSTTGVVGAFELLGPDVRTPVTVIGAAGAMGSGFVEHLVSRDYTDLAVSDLVYHQDGAGPAVSPPAVARHLPAQRQRFTPECLGRGGFIVATTWGEELEHSDLDAIKPGSVLLLAHNLALPVGDAGLHLAARLADAGVTVLPGQILTLGGALTARLEWFWRAGRTTRFDKPLGHVVVDRVVRYWTDRCVNRPPDGAPTPYHAMLAAAG